jgi:hypothetical protein
VEGQRPATGPAAVFVGAGLAAAFVAATTIIWLFAES